jgi:hypothetical protein
MRGDVAVVVGVERGKGEKDMLATDDSTLAREGSWVCMMGSETVRFVRPGIENDTDREADFKGAVVTSGTGGKSSNATSCSGSTESDGA